MAKREATLKTALRSMFQRGDEVRVSTVAETYACGTNRVIGYCRELKKEGVCRDGGTYFADRKGVMLAFPRFVPADATAPAKRTPKFIPGPDSDEQPRADVDIHPNVLLMHMYM